MSWGAFSPCGKKRNSSLFCKGWLVENKKRGDVQRVHPRVFPVFRKEGVFEDNLALKGKVGEFFLKRAGLHDASGGLFCKLLKY